MAPPFDRLAPELIAAVCELIDSPSLGRLRLVSRAFELIFSPYLATRLATLEVDLLRGPLEHLRALSRSPVLARGVRTLNLICIYCHEDPSRAAGHYSDQVARSQARLVVGLGTQVWRDQEARRSREPDRIARDREALAQIRAQQDAFSGADMRERLTACLRRFTYLQTVTLEAVVIIEYPPTGRRAPEDLLDGLVWRRFWTRAVQAYRVVMSAVSRSQARLHTLSLYRETKMCSIPTHDVVGGRFLSRLRAEGFETVAKGLKSLSISVATTTMPIRPRAVAARAMYEPFDLSEGQMLPSHDPEVLANADFEGFLSFLRLMPNLESLSLHLYDSTRRPPGGGTRARPYGNLLSTVFHEVPFPSLRSLTLKGFPTSPRTVRTILSRHPGLRELTLRNLFLQSGSWRGDFEGFEELAPQLTDVRICNLWQPDNRGVVNLEALSGTPRARRHDDGGKKIPGSSFECQDRVVWFEREFTKHELWELEHFEWDRLFPRGGFCYDSAPWRRWWSRSSIECGPFLS